MCTRLLTACVVLVLWSGQTAARTPPTINSDGLATQQTVRAGTSSIKLLCPVDGDNTLMSWEKDGENINLGWSRFRVTNSGLKIKDLAEDDSGRYMCKATNGFGSDTLEYLLYVHPDTNDTEVNPEDFFKNYQPGGLFPAIDGQGEPPTFSHPRDMDKPHLVKPRGSTVRLRCRANGHPRPEIHWFHQGALIHPEPVMDEEDPTQRDKWTLKLSDVRDDHDGRYMCKVQNTAGQINFTYTLEVVDQLEKPEIMDPHPINTTVKFGETTFLQCSVKSEVEPRIQWLKRVDNMYDLRRKNTTITVQDEQFIVLTAGNIMKSNSEDGDTYLNKLIIRDATEQDSGMYICLGANSMGYNIRSAYLTVLQRPGHMQDQYDEGSFSLQSPPSLALIIGLPAGILLILIIIAIYLLQKRRSAAAAKTKTVVRSRPANVMTSPYGVVGVPPTHPDVKLYDHQYVALRPQHGQPGVPVGGSTYGHFQPVPSSDNSGGRGGVCNNYGPADVHSHSHSDSSSTPKQQLSPLPPGALVPANQHLHMHHGQPLPPNQQHMHYHYGI